MTSLRWLAEIGTVVLPIGLIAICIGSIVDPELAANSFGVHGNDKNDAFLIAAGVRDGVLGLLGLLIRFKHSAMLLQFYMILLLIPLCDLVIVHHHGGTLVDGICHILGALGTFGLILLLLLPATTNQHSNKLKPV